MRPAVDLQAVLDVENVNDAAALVDPVDDAIGAAPRTVTTGQWPEERLTYTRVVFTVTTNQSRSYRGRVPVPPETDIARIRRYCRARLPAQLSNQIRIERRLRGAGGSEVGRVQAVANAR
jgi:hypothetical protein